MVRRMFPRSNPLYTGIHRRAPTSVITYFSLYSVYIQCEGFAKLTSLLSQESAHLFFNLLHFPVLPLAILRLALPLEEFPAESIPRIAVAVRAVGAGSRGLVVEVGESKALGEAHLSEVLDALLPKRRLGGGQLLVEFGELGGREEGRRRGKGRGKDGGRAGTRQYK